MKSEKDYPFVTKEITFGNIYDNNDGEVMYTVCQESCGIELDHDQLKHLHKAIGKMLESKKKGGAK